MHACRAAYVCKHVLVFVLCKRVHLCYLVCPEDDVLCPLFVLVVESCAHNTHWNAHMWSKSSRVDVHRCARVCVCVWERFVYSNAWNRSTTKTIYTSNVYLCIYSSFTEIFRCPNGTLSYCKALGVRKRILDSNVCLKFTCAHMLWTKLLLPISAFASVFCQPSFEISGIRIL